MPSDTEQLYVFVDKTGHCFEDFQSAAGDEPSPASKYNDSVGASMKADRKFSVGDMLAFRDDLTDAGFKWGKDFYVNKV